jgi:hypothetical protein
MKFIYLLLIIPLTSFADNLSNSNQLFDFAENSYPNFFNPAGGQTFELSEYLVRYYEETNIYIGTKDEDVYVYGDIFHGLLNVGKISDFIEVALDGDELLAELFENQQSNAQVKGSGIVIALLADDLEGDRHQKFLIKLDSGQTLLVAHNIDLAPKLTTLAIDDYIEFFGEFEWNDKGGLIHWTHHDPAGKHENGWLFHNGILYQSL